jgi:acyl-CoA thioesterase II
MDCSLAVAIQTADLPIQTRAHLHNGGHFVAQALSAGFATVAEPMLAHSLHAYFDKSGTGDAQIEYRIETLRQGRSFASRHVTATQNENVVFSMSMSFKKRDEDEHFQTEMPKVKLAEERRADRVAAGLEMENISNLFKTNEELDDGEERDMDIRMWRRFPHASTTTGTHQHMSLCCENWPNPICVGVSVGVGVESLAISKMHPYFVGMV